MKRKSHLTPGSMNTTAEFDMGHIPHEKNCGKASESLKMRSVRR